MFLTASEDMKNVFFANMSKRMAETVKGDLEITTNVRLKEVEEAQQRIVNLIRKLEDAVFNAYTISLESKSLIKRCTDLGSISMIFSNMNILSLMLFDRDCDSKDIVYALKTASEDMKNVFFASGAVNTCKGSFRTLALFSKPVS